MTEGVRESIVQHRWRQVEEGRTAALCQRICCFLFMRLAMISLTALPRTPSDRLTTPAPGGVMDQRSVIPFEVARQLSDMPLKRQDAGHLGCVWLERRLTIGLEVSTRCRSAGLMVFSPSPTRG